MTRENKDGEIARLQGLIDELQYKASRSELTEQRVRDARNQVDIQLEKFTCIHKYALESFSLSSSDALYAHIAEGVVDIFQVEVGAVFSLDLLDLALVLRGQCNMDSLPARIPLPEHWIQKYKLWDAHRRSSIHESPAPSAPWDSLGLTHVMFMPLFDNERRLDAVIMGGISNASKDFYEFSPREILSPFMVFCQQMNGLLNNLVALDKARQGAQAKSRFLANLSHEIRTPMNAIIGMAQLASRSQDREKISGFIQQITHSSHHLLGLLNEVLDISKIEEGKLALADEPFALGETLAMVADTAMANAQAKKQILTVDYHGLSPLWLTGDSMRLSQVLLNLLTNAVKFTPENGRIRLDVAEVNRDQGKIFIKFEVADTGIGIAPAVLNRIFDPFEQADNSISRKYGGTGLGLAISQRIVQLMGGDIAVESTVGSGTSFHFYVWFALEKQAESEFAAAGQGDEPAPDFSGKTVLIVDDVPINRDIAAAFLEDLGMAVEHAEQGQMAVDMMLASTPGHYQLVLMDMQMPVMDGCTATRSIRASSHPDAGKVPILAMTANVFKEDVQAAMASGMDGYISKPIEYDLVIKTIQGALKKARNLG